MGPLLEQLRLALVGLLKILPQLFPRSAYDEHPSNLPMNAPDKPSGRIHDWALAIQGQEGGKPTDLNMRNCNPGNLKYTAYTASLGAKLAKRATDGGYFCYFDTQEKGMAALCEFLTMAAKNKLAPYHDARTLKLFTQKYAQPPATHPYAENVAKDLGVDVNIDISLLL